MQDIENGMILDGPDAPWCQATPPERGFTANVYVSMFKKMTLYTSWYEEEAPDPNDGYCSPDIHPEKGALEESYKKEPITAIMNGAAKLLEVLIEEGKLDQWQEAMAKSIINELSGWTEDDVEVEEA